MPPQPDLITRASDAHLALRAEPEGDGRTVDLRLVPWGVVADTPQGRETFAPGAFADVDPSRVTVEAGGHGGPLVGRGVAIAERDDGAYLSARISGTPAGDDLLTLTRDGVYSDASVAFLPVADRRRADGVIERTRVDLRRVAILERGSYPGAAVLAVRSAEEPTMPPEATTEVQAVTALAPLAPAAPVPDFTALYQRMDAILATREAVPPPGAPAEVLTRGEWFHAALGAMTGDQGSLALLQRALADNVTSGNPGVMPPTYRQSFVTETIDPSRPFMSSTRRVPVPETGTRLIMPTITQRPLVAVQAADKAPIASRAVTTGTQQFDMATYAGGGDVSWQLIRRASPSFGALFLDLLGEAYAQTTEAAGITSAMAGAQDGGIADLADPSSWRGLAATNTLAAVKRLPDTLWLSAEAVGAFLNATAADGRPMFPALGPSNVQGTASIGSFGSIEGLRAVVVPDPTFTGFAVGWSGSFAWAEEGTFQLSVDRPDVLGRDTAIYGFVWLAPLYPDGITKFALPTIPLASSSSSSRKSSS